MQLPIQHIPIQEIPLDFQTDVQLFIKREDLIHSFVSGNKYRKLYYNIQKAKEENHTILLTFGGAFSNHIAATAAAGKMYGFKTIGIIRGEELEHKEKNSTLTFAISCGMQLKYVTRSEYRIKNTSEFHAQLKDEFGRFYTIPEGGTNELAVKGCKEIISSEEKEFDHICCAVGTGGTISGIIEAAHAHQKVWGFPALKGDFLTTEIQQYSQRNNWELITEYHFGGYGKVTEPLIHFINTFKKNTNIPLDPIYTGKMLFGIIDLIKKGHFDKQKRILAIHTGGLQGIAGMNKKLEQKGLTTII